MQALLNRAWPLLVLVLLVLFLAGQGILRTELRNDVEHADEIAASEVAFFASLMKAQLQAKNFQLAREMVQQLGEHKPRITEIVLQTKNGFNLAHYQSQTPAQFSTSQAVSIEYSYTGLANLTITKSLDSIYSNHDDLENSFLFGFIAIALLLAYLVRVNQQLVMQKSALQEENHRRIEAEASLIKHRDHLEEMVQERTSELEFMRDEALSATRTKSEFLAAMSHELRTPLNSIIGFTGLVKDGESGEVSAEQHKQLSMVYNSARHLLALINDILDLSKVEAGKIEVVKNYFKLEELLDELRGMFEALAAQKNLELVIASPDTKIDIYSDCNKLRQVLINLLGNAIKFTEKGKISLDAVVTDDEITFSVTDTGIGIDEKNLELVFEAFKQADGSDSRLQEGTGLGLAISRSFIELLGGTLSVDSALGKGSRFTISLPREDGVLKTTDTIARSLHRKPAGNENRKVMIIDDEHESRELLQRYLVQEGFDVVTCCDGLDAYEMACEHQPFAITLDIIMPGKDGWDTLAVLKSREETANIPVIIISVLDEENLGLSLGAVDYIQKPVESVQLLSSLKKLRIADNNDILIVDDSEQDRELMQTILDKQGFEVRHAVNGIDAVAEVNRKCPDLILLDLMMPEMNGFEVIQRLRSSGIGMNVPIIVVSAKTLTDSERRYLNEHVEKILIKGMFNRDDMLEEVGQLLRQLT